MSQAFRNSWILIFLLTLCTVSIASIVLYTNKSSAKPDPNKDPINNLSETNFILKCFGIIDLEHGISSLSFMQQGRVKKIRVMEGQRVTTDEILIEQDELQALHRFQEAESALAAAKIQHDICLLKFRTYPEQIIQQNEAEMAMKARLESSKNQLSRKEELQRINQASNFEVAIASQQVEEFNHLLKAEQAKLNEIRALDPKPQILNSEIQINLMLARLKQAQDGIDECKLKSPANGTILRILTSQGNITGGPNHTPAIQFVGDEGRIVRAEIEQEFVGRVKVGQSVQIENETDPSEKWIGHVYHIADWITQRRQSLLDASGQHDVRTSEIIIRLDPNRNPPRLGLAVMISFLPNQ